MPIIYKGRIVQPTMEKPRFRGDYFLHYGPQKKWEAHLESLWQSSTIHASAELQDRFKDGEELPEGSYEIINGLSGNFAFPLSAVEEGSQDDEHDPKKWAHVARIIAKGISDEKFAHQIAIDIKSQYKLTKR